MLNPLVDSLADLSINELEVQTRRAIEYQRQKDQDNSGSGLDNLINVS
jgi:hypothetical protein